MGIPQGARAIYSSILDDADISIPRGITLNNIPHSKYSGSIHLLYYSNISVYEGQY